jgi:hypothetical protein
MNCTSWVGYPNPTNLFEVTAILWKRVTHHYGNVGFGLPLIVLDFLYPAVTPGFWPMPGTLFNKPYCGRG